MDHVVRVPVEPMALVGEIRPVHVRPACHVPLGSTWRRATGLALPGVCVSSAKRALTESTFKSHAMVLLSIQWTELATVVCVTVLSL